MLNCVAICRNFITYLLVLLLIGAVSACGGSDIPMANPSPDGSQLAWPPYEGVAKQSSDDNVDLTGIETSSRSSDCTEDGSDLNIGPAGEMSWAIYSLAGFGPNVDLDEVVVDYEFTGDSPPETEMFVALADYEEGRWHFFLGSPPSVNVGPLQEGSAVSPNGRVHLACIVVGGGTAVVHGLHFFRNGAGTVAPHIVSIPRHSGYEGETFTLDPVVDNDVDASYLWTITGATPTTSTEKNPVVTLGADPGLFSCSLQVTKQTSGDMKPFSMAVITTAPAVWRKAGYDNRWSNQIPIPGPSTGNLAWKYYAAWDPTPPIPNISSVTFADDGSMFFANQRSIVSLNSDGTFRWRYVTPDWAVVAPTVDDDGACYFGVWRNGYYCLEANGTERWHNDSNISSSSTCATIYGDSVYFVGGDKYMRGFDRLTGNPITTPYQYTSTFNKLQGECAMTSQGVYLFASDTTVFAYDVVHDQLLWAFPTVVDLATGPALSPDETLVYVLDTGGFETAINVADGTQYFKVNANTDGSLGRPALQVLADGTLASVTEMFELLRQDPDTGAELSRWPLPLGTESDVAPAVDVDGTFYLSANNSPWLYAIDNGGATAWSYQMGAYGFNNSASISPEGNLLIVSGDGYLYCIGPGSGSTLVPPFISNVSPISGYSDTTLDPVATVSGTGPLSYSWNFGGGATPNATTSATPSVTLGAEGSYDATLTVSSNWGVITYPFTLQVQPDPPPSDKYVITSNANELLSRLRSINGNPAFAYQDSTKARLALSNVAVPDQLTDWKLIPISNKLSIQAGWDVIEFGGKIYITGLNSVGNYLGVVVSNDLNPQGESDWSTHSVFDRTMQQFPGNYCSFAVLNGKLAVLHETYDMSLNKHVLKLTYAKVDAPTQLSDWETHDVEQLNDIERFDIAVLSDGTPAVVRFDPTNTGCCMLTSTLTQPQSPTDWARHTIVGPLPDSNPGYQVQILMFGTHPCVVFEAAVQGGSNELGYGYGNTTKPSDESDWTISQVTSDPVDSYSLAIGAVGGMPALLYPSWVDHTTQLATADAIDPSNWTLSTIDSEHNSEAAAQLLDLGSRTLVVNQSGSEIRASLLTP